MTSLFSSLHRFVLSGLLFLTASLLAATVAARGNGIAAHGCDGCHNERGASVTLTADGPLIPGEEATFTVRITHPNMKSAGVYIPQPEAGTLRALSGEGMALVAAGLTQSKPKPATGGAVTFRFAWRPPATPDGTRFEVFAVAADGNGNSRGDAGTEVREDFVYGCEAQRFYRDFDEDGYGLDEQSIVRCAGAPPEGYSVRGGDCDDWREDVYPGAVEKCNKRDDNCNGEIDEDAEPVELWPDNDGDGYYGLKQGEPILGCVPMEGYAADPGDCDDNNPNVHPGAEEVCNYIDDNCDGRVDERVRPRCGVGFCERQSPSCDPEQCVPGLPSEERCSGLDENCNGYVDEGDLCSGGEVCVSGECMADPVSSNSDQSGGQAFGQNNGGCHLGVGGRAGFLVLVAVVALLGWRRRS